MDKETALQAWKQMRSEIDPDNWLFVGTINPEMVDRAIEALETVIKAETNLPEIPDSWIPFTADTMPKEDGEYFVLYDDMYAEDYDTGRVGVADFYVDCEAFGYWQESYDPVTLGFVDSDFVEIKVKKWMPIPKEEGEADGA